MTQQALPGFLHIGVAKAASTWLFNMCKEHPDVYVPQSPDNVKIYAGSASGNEVGPARTNARYLVWG